MPTNMYGKVFLLFLFYLVTRSSFSTDSSSVTPVTSTANPLPGRALAMGFVNTDYGNPVLATTINQQSCFAGEYPCASVSVQYTSQTGNPNCMIRWIDNSWGVYGTGNCWLQAGNTWALYIWAGEYYGNLCENQNIAVSYTVSCVPANQCNYNTSCT